MKRSISLSVQDMEADCDVRVDRLMNSDNDKYSILRMPKTVEKRIGESRFGLV